MTQASSVRGGVALTWIKSVEIPRGDLDPRPVEHDAAAIITRLGRWGFLQAMSRRIRFGDKDASVARIGADLVAATAGEMELVDVGDRIELGRPVPELFGDEMDHQSLALH